MNCLTSFLLSILYFSALVSVISATVTVRAEGASEPWEQNELLTQGNSPADMDMLRALRQDVKKQGCSINLCFVMDASDAVSEKEFTFQKNFIDIVMAITTVDRPGTYCAVQYHSWFNEISPLTNNRERLLEKVQYAKKHTGGGNITPGLRYAVNQLVKRKNAANKIVMFSRKKPFISRFLPPVLLRFFSIDGVICSVALKESNRNTLIKDVTKDPNLVFPRDGYFEVSEVIFEVVRSVCEMK